MYVLQRPSLLNAFKIPAWPYFCPLYSSQIQTALTAAPCVQLTYKLSTKILLSVVTIQRSCPGKGYLP